MIKKWKTDLQIGEFAEYFENTWLTGECTYWFESSHPLISTNNGLESMNKQLKTTYTLRKKLPFENFVSTALDIVDHWTATSEVSYIKKIFIGYML